MKKILSAVLALFAVVLAASAAGAESNGVYVLMNIPFVQFYEAEVTETAGLDAVSSATLMKTRTGTLAGGSFHEDASGTDITGIIFPVYVEDPSVLTELGGTEITDDSSVTITVTNRGQESTTAYSGAEALFEAPAYSYYILKEEPVQYKTYSDGVFGAVNSDAENIAAEASLIYDRHADIVIRLDGLEEALSGENVSGMILEADDGTRVGMRHIANLWRGMEAGFNTDSEVYDALKGKTVTAIQVLTQNRNCVIPVQIPVVEDERLIALTGSYIELFPEFVKEEYYDFWMECIGLYADDPETAEMYYSMLTDTYMGRLYGQEAVDAYSASPESMLFDCFFENGLAKITICGNIISGTDADGKEVFSHAYTYREDLPISFFGEEFPGLSLHVYETEEEDAGMFTYFAFSDDTLADTQHIEFRYGASLDDLANYSEGEYAYWLPSGTQEGYKESLLQTCIQLFVDENVGGEEAAA